MASSGSVSTNAYNNRNLIFAWSEKSQSTSNLSTTIEWTLKGGGSASSWYETGPVKLYINGDLVYHFKQKGENAWENDGQNTEGRIKLDSGTVVKTGTKTIPHNADGTKSFKVVIEAAIYVWDTNCTAEKTFTLDPIVVAEYEVTYNANGGSGAPSKQSKQHGVDLTLSSTKPTKSCKITYNANNGSVSPASKDVAATFVEWNTRADGTGTSYQPGAKYTGNADVTLYAIWEYNKAGTLATPTRTNCTFRMWTTTLNGNTAFTSNSVVSSNVTIYAKWAYKIIFNGNGGTLYDAVNDVAGSQIVDIKEHGAVYTIPEYTASYDEDSFSDVDEDGNVVVENESSTRTFLGYATSASATKALYVAGDTYLANEPCVLYAVYKTNTYTVAFYDGYSGTLLKEYTNVAHGSSVQPPPDPVRKGYTFAGWLGDYSYVISNRKIVAFWGSTPIWVMTTSGWQRYEPEE